MTAAPLYEADVRRGTIGVWRFFCEAETDVKPLCEAALQIAADPAVPEFDHFDAAIVVYLLERQQKERAAKAAEPTPLLDLMEAAAAHTPAQAVEAKPAGRIRALRALRGWLRRAARVIGGAR